MKNFFANIPPITRHLLIINVLVWIAQQAVPRATGFDLTTMFSLHYWGASDFNPVQFVTYMFLHAPGDFTHLFFNMFTLIMFGPILERALGSKRFITYYAVCGVGAAIMQELVWTFTWRSILIPLLAEGNSIGLEQMTMAVNEAIARGDALPFLNSMQTIGASGAVFGLLLAFGMLFPELPMFILFIPIPIKAKWVVIGYGAMELAFGVTGLWSSVAHFAHLGGMVFGLGLLLYWRSRARHNNNFNNY